MGVAGGTGGGDDGSEGVNFEKDRQKAKVSESA